MIICSPQLGISPESNLGGEVYDRELLKSIAQLGQEVEVVLPCFKKHPVENNFHITWLPIPFVYPPFVFNLLIIPYLLTLYSKKKFKFLRVHSLENVGFAAALFKYFHPEVKIVLSFHHFDKTLIERFAVKILRNFVDIVVVDSNNIASEVVEQRIFPAERIHVIPAAIDRKYKPLAKDKQLLSSLKINNSKVLLYLGQLIARKNISFLFAIIKELPEEWKLVICGSGPLRAELENKVERLGLTNRVIFTGQISETDKIKFYNLADIFVYPSTNEGFGLSVLEAMSCGKVVIVNNLPAFRDIINANQGVLLSLDKHEWIDKIKQLSANVVQLKKLSSNARKRSLDFSWTNTAKLYIEMLANET